jgi:hypothetical protein
MGARRLVPSLTSPAVVPLAHEVLCRDPLLRRLSPAAA